MATYVLEYTPSTAADDFTSLVAVQPSPSELKRAVNADAAFSGDAIDGVNVIPDSTPKATVEFVKGTAFSGAQQTAIDAIAAAHTGTGALEQGGTRPMGDAQPRDPGVNDDDAHGFSSGSIFVNTVTKRAFLCVDNTTGAAVWQDVGNAFSGGEQVKSDGTDNTPDYLFNKLVEGTDIDIEVFDSGGGNRKVRITSTATGGGGNDLAWRRHFLLMGG